MVLYADEVSFTLMTPEGHMFAGWITFSAFDDGDGVVAQTQVLMRAQDPIGELGLTFGGHGKENTFWKQTLVGARRVARRRGRRGDDEVVCVDRKRQWSRATNVRNSVAIRSTLHMLRPGK